MKPQSYLAFHLAFWGMIALGLAFSSPSEAGVWTYGSGGNTNHPVAYELCRIIDPNVDPSRTWVRDSGNTNGIYRLCMRANFNGTNTEIATIRYRCDNGVYPAYGGTCAEWPTDCTVDPETGDCEVIPEGETSTCGGSGTQPQTVCLSGTRHTTGGVGVQLDSGWAASCTSTGDSCTGEESSVNPNYDLPVLPKTDQSVEIDGVEYPLVESGCGEVAGSLVCTNEPNCGEFNGEWICTGPDNGTEGVPASPDYEYTVNGSTTAERAGDQYYYNSTTVSNSTNLGTGGAGDSTDPTDSRDPTRPTDGSYSDDPNAPLGQGSCPAGYVQTGITANGDGSTDAQCVPDGGSPDWMGWADKLDMSDQLPSSWMTPPGMPDAAASGSVCPAPLAFTFLGNSIEISLEPFCDLANILRPFLIALGYLFAALFVFRALGSS